MSAVMPGGAGVAAPRSAPAGVAPIVEPHLPSAAERLEASRARLRSALLTLARPPAKPTLLDNLGLGSFGNLVMARLKALPGAAIILAGLEHWWVEHPLHTVGVLAEEASRRFVAPIASRNPYAVVVGGIVVGALFAASKPWRWLLRPALFVGIVPQVATQALKRMPLESWLQMLNTLTGKRASSTKSAARPDPASGLPRTS